MLPLLADENFNGDIVRGLLLRQPGLDIIRVQDIGLAGADDPDILSWAAENNYIVLTSGMGRTCCSSASVSCTTKELLKE